MRKPTRATDSAGAPRCSAAFRPGSARFCFLQLRTLLVRQPQPELAAVLGAPGKQFNPRGAKLPQMPVGEDRIAHTESERLRVRHLDRTTHQIAERLVESEGQTSRGTGSEGLRALLGAPGINLLGHIFRSSLIPPA